MTVENNLPPGIDPIKDTNTPPDSFPAAPPEPTEEVVSPAGEPQVGVIMGSQSDWPTMIEAARILSQLGVPFETHIVSAHRTPDRMVAYASKAQERGLKAIIAGAGGAAHLPGMVAAMTPVPVLGVPVQSRSLNGLDSLLSIVQMPGGVPVGTFAIGTAGAKNAGLFAVAMLAGHDETLAKRLDAYRMRQTESVALTPDAD